MALGVLNNLSAIYAENNLNNTNSSLQTVLQQLSSGSKINSGADDAAGLSLVNGLEANSMALMQSKTNATEGVGLLDVADGALSQVTSLLDRAITLATEASNGTLNSTQEGAANQEYQSILAEISNIGSTTTYNQEQVFSGNIIAVYTGDSSTAGSSVDNLNIHTLSVSSVGDTNGVMSYGNGNGATGTNVFIDLSNNGVNAALGDTLNASGATSIQVTYLKTGANGVVTPTTANVGVGTGTSYANTVQGLMSAINNSGLGLSATFGTAAQAGSGAVSTARAALHGGGSGSDTGIIITGNGVGTGTAAGEVGALSVGGTPLDLLAGSLTITGADGTSHTITLGQADSTDNINNLAATINADGYGITAAVAGSTLTFTSASSAASISAANLDDTVTAVDGTAPVVAAGAAPKGNVAGNIGTFTLGNASDIITGGTLAITGQSGTLTNFTLGTSGTTDNLTDLAKTINNWAATTAAGAGVSATVVGGVLTIHSAGGGAAGVQTALGLAGGTSDTVAGASTSINLTGTPTNQAASTSTIGTLTLGGVGESVTDVLNGTLTIGTNTITLGGTGTTDTLQDLAKTIDEGDYGVTATYSQTNKDIVFTSSNSALGAGGALAFTAAAGGGDQTAAAGTVTYAPAAPVSTAEDYYSIGISSAGGIQDQSTAVVNGGTTYGGTLNTGFTTDTSSTGGIATMSYTDANGQSLVGTDLLNQTNAQSALNVLNLAISDVAAQDGYIGAQINTLNSVSQVMTTQQENVTSAQNAIQATDYASATSNMSKYEILSQTGIAALAQANSVQQEVTKLLQ
jgi:flagellin